MSAQEPTSQKGLTGQYVKFENPRFQSFYQSLFGDKPAFDVDMKYPPSQDLVDAFDAITKEPLEEWPTRYAKFKSGQSESRTDIIPNEHTRDARDAKVEIWEEDATKSLPDCPI